MRKIVRNPTFYICLISLAAAVTALLFLEGEILLNSPSLEKYPIRGADVSVWQGEIDWQTFGEGMDFVFIKATEGSGHIDARFRYNLEQARKQGIPCGAYHFFSYDSAGASQAENFISAVPVYEDMLPPVIDVEFYGDKEKHLPEKAEVTAQLSDMIEALSAHYGKTPIIYATKKFYDLYVAGEFLGCPVWIREVTPTACPVLSDGREWTFWQYTNRYKAEGLSGGVRFVDMNVFNGTAEEFSDFLADK